MTLVSVSGSLTTMIQVDMMWLSSTLSKKLLAFMTCVPILLTNPPNKEYVGCTTLNGSTGDEARDIMALSDQDGYWYLVC